MYAGVPPRLSAWKMASALANVVRDAREAPVHHQHFAEVAEHDVLGLQIAMDDAVGVGERHRVGDAQQDAQVLVERLLLEHLVPGRALHALHRVEERAGVVGAEVVDRHDVRVVELAGDDRFGDELVALLLADLGRGLEHLHGDGAGDRRLVGRVDDAHAALADHFEQLVVGHVGRRARRRGAVLLPLADEPRLHRQRRAVAGDRFLLPDRLALPAAGREGAAPFRFEPFPLFRRKRREVERQVALDRMGAARRAI